MRAAGAATSEALAEARRLVRVGATPLELDAAAERVIRERGGVPNFALEPGYRHTLCVSVNDDVVHGVPTQRPFEPGDLVSIDGGALVDGWNGDAAFSVVLPDDTRPELIERRRALVRSAEHALWAGVAALAHSKRLGEVGAAIEDAVDDAGAEGAQPYEILAEYVGHGIGRTMHEKPTVFNYRVRQRGPRVGPGLVVAIEPIIVAGDAATFVRDDGWTVATVDGGDGAHVEHSVAVHDDGVWVLTAPDGGAAELARFGIVPSAVR